MGRYTKDHIIADDQKLGVQFQFSGADYKTIVGYLKTAIDKDTGKPMKLTKFLGNLVSRTAESIRNGKKIHV